MSHYHKNRPRRKGVVTTLWQSFWLPPSAICPRCGKAQIEYYDPFFFSPIRTLKGRRRLKCLACKFVWRPSSRGRSYLQMLNPFSR